MKIPELLQPLNKKDTQVYLGKGLHTLGLIGWILEQTGRADVFVSTFSTSDAFLSGFLRLKEKGLIKSSTLVADLKASRKTVALSELMKNSFDVIRLSNNHSKIVLVDNGRDHISVISSQNQTYGDRAECTMITSNAEVYDSLKKGLDEIISKSINISDGLYRRNTIEDRKVSERDDDPLGDIIPFGY